MTYVPGPSLPYLQQRVNVALSVLAQSLVAKDVGKVVGSPIVGIM